MTRATATGAANYREQELAGHVLSVIERGWGFVYRNGRAEDVFREELERFHSIRGQGRDQALEGILLRLVEAGWPHVYDRTRFASDTAKRVFAKARDYLEAEAFGNDVLQTILEEHPEIHVEQARDGKWNFRHDDNEHGPDDEYFRRGCYVTQAGAILAALDEYGVEIESKDVRKSFVPDASAEYFIRCDESNLGLLKSFGMTVGTYDHHRGGVLIEASESAKKMLADFPEDFKMDTTSSKEELADNLSPNDDRDALLAALNDLLELHRPTKARMVTQEWKDEMIDNAIAARDAAVARDRQNSVSLG